MGATATRQPHDGTARTIERTLARGGHAGGVAEVTASVPACAIWKKLLVSGYFSSPCAGFRLISAVSSFLFDGRNRAPLPSARARRTSCRARLAERRKVLHPVSAHPGYSIAMYARSPLLIDVVDSDDSGMRSITGRCGPSSLRDSAAPAVRGCYLVWLPPISKHYWIARVVGGLSTSPTPNSNDTAGPDGASAGMRTST
jgi:hypothetical protein